MKLILLNNQDGELSMILFWCPACNEDHPYSINKADPDHNWDWNGDMEKPSFTPSLRVYLIGPEVHKTQCHLYVTDGMIRYCDDSPHALRGQTVPLPDYPITDPFHPDYKDGV